MAAFATTLSTVDRPRVLLAVASNIEAAGVRNALGVAAPQPLHPQVGRIPWRIEALSPCIDMVVTGVGKVNAAAGVASTLHDAHAGVISLGIGGILQRSGATIGDVVIASAMRYPDEGLETPDGYTPLAAMGFPHGPFDEGLGLIAPGDWVAAVRERLLATLAEPSVRVHVGPIATVSTCSGTDALAQQVARRTGAVAEAMEGAAACQVAAWHGVKFAEVRVLSNTTGDRLRQQWDIKRALETLARVAAAIA